MNIHNLRVVSGGKREKGPVSERLALVGILLVGSVYILRWPIVALIGILAAVRIWG